MTKLLLSVHVLAAILAIGPIAVAASLFPRFARDSGDARAPDDRKPDAGNPKNREPDDRRGPAIAAFLHRICRGYTVVGLAVPVFGLATGAQLGVLGDAWLITSIVLTTIAAALLALAILPTQQRLLAAPADGTDTAGNTRAAAAARLAMTTGIFNLLWAIVVVLMIVRPGSTTGA
ncbi:hypothetical protein B7755_027725 [Streptomyces sp. NBS 14/10]|uniref:hypothetical protein n=1 Tax=Streptomyces sp. NBS 14/10 TaxID=1945643 RepID=UPI000B7E7586|nr:hypothetical protein [Streptomyces sp. NBS 14/10]KAK1181598.1 hypothetical protein B7755_027725 [Streptomyces sp. NBS 14/10]